MKWLLLFRPAAIAPRITGDDDLLRPLAVFALLTTLATYLADQASSQTFAAAGYTLPPNVVWTYYLNVIVWPFIPAAEAISFDLVARKLFGLQGAFRRLIRLFYYVGIGTTVIMLLFVVVYLLVDSRITDVRQAVSGKGIAFALAGGAFAIYSSLVGLYLVKTCYPIGYGTALVIATLGHIALMIVVGIPGLMILTRFGTLGEH